MPNEIDPSVAALAVPSGGAASVFGFGDALTALTLIMVFYTFTDARYRFRLAIAPIPIATIGFIALSLVGSLSLIVDLWFGLQWPLPTFLGNQLVWQGVLAAVVLVVMVLWIYYGFVSPPVFSHSSARRYFRHVYQLIVRGADPDFAMIADELDRSADALIRLSTTTLAAGKAHDPAALYKKSNADTAQYAFQILYLIGHKRLCRHFVESSSTTVLHLFEAMSRHRRYVDALGPFSANIGAENLLQKDSPLYHEDHGYDHGLLGQWRPYTNAVYGDFDLVEGMGRSGRSPLDVDYRLKFDWNANQLEAFCRAILITWGSYLRESHWRTHSYVLKRAMRDVAYSTHDIYEIDGVETGAYDADSYRRLDKVMHFLREMVREIDKAPERPLVALRRKEDNEYEPRDVYDLVVQTLFEVIQHAGAVSAPLMLCWTIQHNSVWSCLFREETAAWKVIHRKLRRLLYNCIKEIPMEPDFVRTRVMGFCLNVMGLTLLDGRGYRRQEYPLHRMVLKIAKDNFLALNQEWPALAAECLKGGVTFDAASRRLVKTFVGTFGKEGPKEYLALTDPNND